MEMTSVQSLINQQYGISKWTNCDNIIQRLRCLKEEQYNQLLPSEDGYCDTPIFACKFAQKPGYEGYLALANEDGKLAVHNTSGNSSSNHQERFGIRAHNNAIFDLAWMFGRMKIVTASGDHMSKLFDITESEIRQEKIFTGHSRSVKTVAFRTDDPSIFATGGRDGHIILWDIRTDIYNILGRTDRAIMNSHNVKVTPSKRNSVSKLLGVKSVTGLVFQDENTLISCGAGDGVIKVWDIRKSYFTYKNEAIPKNKIPYSGSTTKNGYSSLIIDKECMKLYANCLDNNIYCYNLNTYNPVPIMKYSGHQNSTFYIKSSLSNNGLYLISGSSDDNAYIWNTNHSNPLLKLTGHNAEVTCVAWCPKNDFSLVTCSDDMTHKIWRIGTEFLPDNWEIIGKGQAEVLPIIPPVNRKRKALITTPAVVPPKKLFNSCHKIGNTEDICGNCSKSSKKRIKSPNDDAAEQQVNKKRFRSLFPDLNSEIQSPTINLPNYVIDGTAPHLNFSPPKKKCQDWLTRMRIERKFKRAMMLQQDDDLSLLPTSLKQPRLDLKMPKTTTASQQSPILRFFKITNSSSSNKTTVL